MKKESHFIAGYKVLEEQGLIVELRSGLVRIDCLLAYTKVRTESKNYANDLDIIVDISEMDFDFIISEMEEYASHFVKFSKMTENNKKIAIIAATPNQLAYSNVMSKMLSKNANVNFFPDLASSCIWLNKSLDIEIIKEAKEEIRKNSQYKCSKD